jgi:NADPH-dependent 2,4-dienoyl-CoA reductase/sulfur reductase-like enzyme/Fe-S-cluster-containing hydrogenase component 2
MSRILSHPVLPSGTGTPDADFTFEGLHVLGRAGEPVSSALMALGIADFSRHHKDGSPQGLFCANGQCSQCTMLIDGMPRKACLTPLAEGMDVCRLRGLPSLPIMDEPFVQAEQRTIRTDILVIGGGPSGLTAAFELGRMGFQVLVADDKEKPGGKLVLQTHKFFGSEKDCHAGVRGMDISGLLEKRLSGIPNVTIVCNAPVVAIFKDRRAGLYKDYSSYLLVDFTALVVATGAREKALLFPGNDLPGVFGAGAFQTIVNRDLVAASRRILIVGSGNVGLIAAYHALQAGIEVAAIVEMTGRITGYRVHADKIRRLGVPIHLNTTIMKAGPAGSSRVEMAITARVDDRFQPIPGTEKSWEIDTVLIAAGLVPCDEFLMLARSYGIMAVSAGDAGEIAEASSAMFGGRLAAFNLAQLLGRRVEIDPSLAVTRDILKSRPGDSFSRSPVQPGEEWRPVFFCSEEIPCNPCATVCPFGSIGLRSVRGTMMDLPYFEGSRCSGCGSCVAICPGLAISLVRRTGPDEAEVVLPWELPADFPPDAEFELVDQEGTILDRAKLSSKRWMPRQSTWLLDFRTTCTLASSVAGARLAGSGLSPGGRHPEVNMSACSDEDAIVCRCERITLGELTAFIRENKVRDINQLKSLRTGMGACGGKTCSQLVGKAFKAAGVDPADIEPGSLRPLFMEVPMGELVNEGLSKLGGRDAHRKGAP